MKLFEIFDTSHLEQTPLKRSQYQYDPSGIKNFVHRLIKDGQEPQVIKLPIEDLHATQWYLDPEEGGAGTLFKKYKKYPVVLQDESGKYHILDGHHRTAKKHEKGKDSIKVYLFKQ